MAVKMPQTLYLPLSPKEIISVGNDINRLWLERYIHSCTKKGFKYRKKTLMAPARGTAITKPQKPKR